MTARVKYRRDVSRECACGKQVRGDHDACYDCRKRTTSKRANQPTPRRIDATKARLRDRFMDAYWHANPPCAANPEAWCEDNPDAKALCNEACDIRALCDAYASCEPAERGAVYGGTYRPQGGNRK